jgi:hypothetical protein
VFGYLYWLLQRDKTNTYRVLVWKSDSMGLFGRPRTRWKNNNKMGLIETALNAVDWIDPAQHKDKLRAFVNTVMSVRVAKDS